MIEARDEDGQPVPLFADERAAWAVQELLLALGEDTQRAALLATPERVARMYADLLTPKPFTFTTFDAEGADQLVLVRDIPFYSLCEHHLIPFHGHATVGYIPQGKIAGLSKLARAVDHFAHRLQTQERMTRQIAEYIQERLQPFGVGVVLTAEHLCMAMRGAQKPGTLTTTSALIGALKDQPETRAEFLALAYNSDPKNGRR